VYGRLEADPAYEEGIQSTERKCRRYARLEIAPGDEKDEKAERNLRLDRQESCNGAGTPRFVIKHEHDHGKRPEKHERVHLPRIESKHHGRE
jgi:hypothetical protein